MYSGVPNFCGNVLSPSLAIPARLDAVVYLPLVIRVLWQLCGGYTGLCSMDILDLTGLCGVHVFYLYVLVGVHSKFGGDKPTLLGVRWLSRELLYCARGYLVGKSMPGLDLNELAMRRYGLRCPGLVEKKRGTEMCGLPCPGPPSMEFQARNGHPTTPPSTTHSKPSRKSEHQTSSEI